MHDVLIAGAGPVGLFLACELGLAGCSVVVLEQESEPYSPWRADPLGMRFLSATSVAAFNRRAMLPALLTASGVSDSVDLDPDATEVERPRSAGHFAGITLDPSNIDLAGLPVRLPGLASDAVPTTLEAVESVLSRRAVELGVQIRRGVPVSAVNQHGDRVVVQAGEHEHAARWLIGCDGAHSAVRSLAGFDLVGTDPLFTGYVMHAAVADPEKLRPGFTLTPTGMYVQMRAAGHIGMLDCDGGAFDRSQSPTREHLQSVLRRVSGTDVTLTDIMHASSFTDRAMQATTYRRGCVLLAGDAAHIHSPLGGQGLNTGLDDAMNLGWKLAATVHGSAPDGLVDTYGRERHPVAAAVLDWTRAQAAAMRPDPYAQALQGMLRDVLATRDGTTYVFARLSGAAIRYDIGEGHPLIGRDAPDFRFADGTRLADLLREGTGIALDFSADRCLHAAATGWSGRIRYAPGPVRNDLGLGGVLVRPDGVIAWADGRKPDRARFKQAAVTWFGDPVA